MSADGDLPLMTVQVARDGAAVRLARRGGQACEVAAPWLFDHADAARSPVSGQRMHGAGLLEGVGVSEARIEGDQLVVGFTPSGAEGRIPLAALGDDDAYPAVRPEPWSRPDVVDVAAPIAFRDYLADDGALREALARVVRHGLVVLTGAGDSPGAVEHAVARFGYVRETNYGRLFDVRIEPKPGNLAYTDRALDLHTDNPYRASPPTLQLLHALVVDAGGGGESLFVDGFAQGEDLRRQDPEAFAILASEPVRFTYRDADGARWSAVSPILRLDVDGRLEQVRLNHRSLDLRPGDAAAQGAWYDAYLAFWRRVHAPQAAFERRLGVGDMVIFDNRRILHARRAITAASPRWLQGCYADVDGLLATLARFDPGREAGR
jgi:gamma-butyrobetaine dioxygenase